MPQSIITRIYNFKLNGVQLNGDENTVMIDNLKTTVIGDITPSLDVIKTIEVNSYDDLDKALPFEGHADMIFFKLNPSLLVSQEISKTVEALNNFTSSLPFFVGGAADESFVNALKEIKNQAFLGLNVDAEIETEEGLKDIEKLQSLQQLLAR
jgi:phosphoribosylanthranilate isomerase